MTNLPFGMANLLNKEKGYEDGRIHCVGTLNVCFGHSRVALKNTQNKVIII